MFEKEAEEWVSNNFKFYLRESSIVVAKHAFQDGAEFGYNKAKEDADKMKSQFLELCNLKDMRIAELDKANEWHYVNWKYFADKDYPKSESSSYLVQLKNKDLLICDWETEEGFGCFWDSNLNPIDNDDVYAWLPLVPPKESE